MKTADRRVLRGAVLKQLRSVYGIHLRNRRVLERTESLRRTTGPQSKLFGVALQQLQMRNVDPCGFVPCFLVDCCKLLLKHAGSEGLFRKSGSVVRLRALKARLDKGEDCLATSLPCDVASLVKHFFYELPSPILPAELLQAFTGAQHLATEEERSAATQLVSCLLPDINLSTLRFFFSFLKQVSLRAFENKMDSYNLSVVLTPNLFQLHTASEWKDDFHRLHIAVICTLIDNAHTFGVIPDTIASDPAVVDSPLPNEECAGFSWKKKGRRSSKVLTLSTAETPNVMKNILSDDAGEVFPHKKRKFFRRSLGMVPSVLFGRCYDSSSKQEDSSPSAVLNRHCSNLEKKGSSKLCQSVKRVVSNSFCCGTSSPKEIEPPHSPVASYWHQPYQDTPVGLSLKKHICVADSVPNKPAISRVFKNLCCASATDSPEDRKCLTQDELALSFCHSDSMSACLGNCVTPLKDRSTTSNLEDHGRQVVDADQRQLNKEKFILSVNCSKSELLSKLTSNFDLSPLSCPLIPLGGGADIDTCRDDLVEVSERNPSTTKTSGMSKVRVVDHVEKYDKQNLKPVMPKTPLKLKCTPVYHYVKRLNSRLKRGKLLK